MSSEAILGFPGEADRELTRHAGKRLAGKAVISPGEAGPVTARLEPWGVLSGRLVDADGQPRAGMVMTSRGVLGKVDPASGSLQDDLIAVGKDGRFKAEGLVPGLKYTFDAGDPRRGLGPAVKDISLGAGECGTWTTS